MKGFIKASGQLLTDGSSQPYLIKGMAFGNNVWQNPAEPPNRHHTAESYRELSGLGFNSVRFYLNYGLFEKDGAPYAYDGMPGWAWLDWNIAEAKKNGIRLVLNMHYPHGGFQSLGNGTELWRDRALQKRLISLWVEIAKRYKNETAVAAFDLVNEPVVPKLASKEETLAQWPKLAQEITAAIRTVDTEHLIFIERLNAVKDLETGIADWDIDMNGEMNFFLIDDINVAYEFHNYDPFAFTHQNAGWVESTIGVFTSYPNADFGKGDLERMYLRFLEFGKRHNVPLYLGEFGVIRHGFEEGRGGERWIKDALDLCKKHRINYNYHTYHEHAFGLYGNGADELPGKFNAVLAEAFRESR
jgi:aryl-phospho-beta-D-glucosidase BglC (GH1 family)